MYLQRYFFCWIGLTTAVSIFGGFPVPIIMYYRNETPLWLDFNRCFKSLSILLSKQNYSKKMDSIYIRYFRPISFRGMFHFYGQLPLGYFLFKFLSTIAPVLMLTNTAHTLNIYFILYFLSMKLTPVQWWFQFKSILSMVLVSYLLWCR